MFANTQSSGLQAGRHALNLEPVGDPVAHGILARRDECLRIDIDRDDTRGAEFSAAMPSIPEPHP